MAEEQIPEQDSTANSKMWVFIGPPFNTGRMVDIDDPVPIAFCEHRNAAPMKHYEMNITDRGINLIKRLFGK